MSQSFHQLLLDSDNISILHDFMVTVHEQSFRHNYVKLSNSTIVLT